MISLECGELNDTLINILDTLRSTIVDYFIQKNFEQNRRYVCILLAPLKICYS